ncbi:DNA primase [Paenibacillus urinalis]|uniref:DNA primase n=1 Tax=Paenibacillus urinalis TaxID=521520 RepID=A0AAX3MXF2_9BACL|nr:MULTISPECIES: DNA primase [Paenibacillus]WDH81564.1 DNA primase [Paenibacillus urinalis]WDH97608.1 DNA primase [Paenibacillus urinalis]WDI01281.1 DNA primase [Paenibacillus urinalis]GAK39652.1 DNA primase [Paenibacillus sp. TCA20]
MSAGQGNIPESVIESVLSQHDIVDTVSKFVHLTKQGKYMKGLCPFHSENTPSFTVTPERQIFYCYGCGKGGNAIKFRMEIEGLTFPEAVKTMAEESHIPLGEWQGRDVAHHNPETERLLQAYELTAKLYHYLLKNTEYGKAAIEYLRNRGMNDKAIDHFQIGYAPAGWNTLVQFLTKREFPLAEMEKGGLISARNEGEGYVDRFRDRVMFPIKNSSGKIIAFAGRIMGDGQPKYLNSPETRLFNKSRVLYNMDHAKASIRKKGQAILFEGYGDVISAWEHGIQNGVAGMGTALTENQARMLKSLSDEVIICYDGDRAGQAAALKNLPILESAGIQAKVALLTDGLDPDEFIRKHGGDRFTHQIIEGAVPPIKFRLINLKKNHILLEEGGRIAYSREAIKLIAPLSSPTEREVYLRELASEVHVDFETLKQECNLERQQMQKNEHYGDNNDKRWNNGRQQNRQIPTPNLLPAYHTAERRLLSWMLQDDEAARYVGERLGEAFNISDHAAIAAYLYAYYAQGKPPDLRMFMLSLQDDRLEKTVSSISMMDAPEQWDHGALDDCIKEVLKYPVLQQIDSKKEEMIAAERSGDFLRAAQIASEIITLERQ